MSRNITPDEWGKMPSHWILGVILATSLTPAHAQQTVANGGAPVVSPDGQHIAFLSNRSGEKDDVFVITPEGRHETQLTRTPDDESSVQWSASGKQVVFARFVGGTSRIYSINIDGSNEREIGSVPGRSPAFSPDGSRLVYMAGDSWTTTKLMVAESDGSHARQINDGGSIAWNNRWSPDGRRIAFTGRNAEQGLAIFVMNSDGSDLNQVTHLAAAEGNAQWPAWSPDGHQLAFQVNRVKAKTADIWVVDLASGKAHALAPHQGSYVDETPSWFPDGKHIAFQSNRSGTMEVWSMSADGSEARQVTGLQLPGQ